MQILRTNVHTRMSTTYIYLLATYQGLYIDPQFYFCFSQLISQQDAHMYISNRQGSPNSITINKQLEIKYYKKMQQIANSLNKHEIKYLSEFCMRM